MKWGTGHFGADETSSQRGHVSARVTVCVCVYVSAYASAYMHVCVSFDNCTVT